MQNIFEIAKKHKVIVPSVPAFGDILFDEEFAVKNKESITNARNLLADDLSVKVFDNILEFYKTGELSLLDGITTDKDEAFSLLSLGENETYVDLGAYNGDTVDEFCITQTANTNLLPHLNRMPKTTVNYRRIARK